MIAVLLLACSDPAPVARDHLPEGVITTRRAGDHEVLVRRAGAGTELVLDGVVVLGDGWNPDRPAVADDGTVAFVSGRTGITSVWVKPPQGDPVQVTNVGLEGIKRSPGRPPPGFVPPPVDDSLRFDGEWLRWNGPDGQELARWR